MKLDLKEVIKEIHPQFSQDELEKGLSFFQLKNCSAKEVIHRAGPGVCPLFIASHSISRCYYLDQDNEEITLWMKPEKTFFSDFKSFGSEEDSRFFLQLYEDSELYFLSREKYIGLCQTYQSWATFARKLMEKQHSTLIDVFVSLLANDASSNYQYIQYAFPRFIHVAPLKDIASMLQISPVTLSRIRSGQQTRSSE